MRTQFLIKINEPLQQFQLNFTEQFIIGRLELVI